MRCEFFFLKSNDECKLGAASEFRFIEEANKEWNIYIYKYKLNILNWRAMQSNAKQQEKGMENVDCMRSTLNAFHIIDRQSDNLIKQLNW